MCTKFKQWERRPGENLGGYWNRQLSNQDGVTGIGLNLLPKTIIKQDKIYEILSKKIWIYHRNTESSVPYHHNKMSISIKQVIYTFWFPSTYKSYVYTPAVS